MTVTQIADEADVSIATLFKHVPDGKQALIFDDGAERRAALLAAVRERPAGRSVLHALHAYLARRGPFARDLPQDLRRRDLVMNTPKLSRYQRRLWLRAETPLAEALAAESGRAASTAAVIAGGVVDAAGHSTRVVGGPLGGTVCVGRGEQDSRAAPTSAPAPARVSTTEPWAW